MITAEDKRELWACCAIGCIAFCIIFFVIIVIPHSLGRRRPAWMSRAKGTLRSIGSAQLAYQRANDKRVYGSFQALQDVEDIASGYNLGNMIENYSLTWEANTTSTVPTEGIFTHSVSTFTIIAWPTDTRKRSLHTYAITEDQIVREFNPGHNNDLGNAYTWDPIL